MSGAIKMEGFQPSTPAGSNTSPRPSIGSRPFSDGSMTVDSSILSSLMSPTQPFSFGGSSLPAQSPFDYGMVSPQSNPTDLPSPHSSFQPPHSLFGHLNFGAENREPPISLENGQQQQQQQHQHTHANHNQHDRSRSQSSSRSSHVGKAPQTKSRHTRKLSMNDVRPNMSAAGGRGRTTNMHPPRSMSFQQDVKPNMNSFAAQRHNSLSTTNEYGFDQQYGISIPRNGDYTRSLWEPGSAPSVLPNSMATFGASVDGALDSPVTPAQNIQQLLGDEGRKQRRRECHNQVEKRRREHINAMIEELNKLLPQKFKMPLESEVIEDEEEEEMDSPVKKRKNKRAASTSKAAKDAAQCKGRILSDSVQYIRDLQSVTEQQSNRIKYLESMLMSGPQWTEEYPAELEMRTSPEGDNLVPLQSDWNSNMLVFETSPTEASSGDVQRSTPHSSGSPGTDSKDAVVWGLMELTGGNRRKDSAAEIQSSMSNMELEVDARRPWF